MESTTHFQPISGQVLSPVRLSAIDVARVRDGPCPSTRFAVENLWLMSRMLGCRSSCAGCWNANRVVILPSLAWFAAFFVLRLWWYHGVRGAVAKIVRRRWQPILAGRYQRQPLQSPAVARGQSTSMHPGGEHLYVLQFDNGVIKVGRTGDPRTRHERHERDCGRYGLTIKRRGVSEEWQGAQWAERQLVTVCAKIGRPTPAGREYFRDVLSGYESQYITAYASYVHSSHRRRQVRTGGQWRRGLSLKLTDYAM